MNTATFLTTPAIPRLSFSPGEVAQATSLSLPMVRKLIREGKLKAVKAGTRLLIPAGEVQRLLS